MTTDTRPDIWTRLSRTIGHLFGSVLRLLFVILLAVGIGAGIYYGLPWAYRTLVEPVQVNRAEISTLSQQFENFRESAANAGAAQDERLTTLETSDDSRRERLAAAESGITGLEAALAAETAARKALEAKLADQQSAIASQAKTITEMQKSLDQFAVIDGQLASLRQQIVLARLQNYLLQARLQVVAENLGEARTLLKATAEKMLAFIAESESVSESNRVVLTSRLATAQSLIETQPASALSEMESIQFQLEAALSTPQPVAVP